jgi:hypothetical protein
MVLEQPGQSGTVELITTEFTGPCLVGDPDPAFPGHSPAYSSSGELIGWMRTGDLG